MRPAEGRGEGGGGGWGTMQGFSVIPRTVAFILRDMRCLAGF